MVFLVNKPDIKYRFWLSVPQNPRHVVFWFHGSTTESVETLSSSRPIEFELAVSLLPDDCIVVTPLIPKLGGGTNGRVVDPQCLSRTVVFDHLLDPELAAYNRPDREVLKMFDYLKDFIFPVLGIMPDRFVVGGFSAGGNFATLFAVLHPSRVTHVMSIMSCAYCLPAESIRNVPFDFPFGVGKLDLVSGIAPDVEAQKDLRYFIYHGERDENDPIEYLANNDPMEARAIKSIMGETTVERARFALEFLTQTGCRVEGHLMPGVGHEIHDREALGNMFADFLHR